MEENKNSRTIKQGNRECWKEHKKWKKQKYSHTLQICTLPRFSPNSN